MTINVNKAGGTLAGVLLAAVIGIGAVKFNPAITAAAPESAPAVVAPAAVPETPVDPNQAQVVVNAQTDARVGELVTLDVSASNANSFAWRVVPETLNFKVFDAGKTAVFSGEAQGEYLFVIAAAKDDTVDVEIHKIKVGAGGTVPVVESIGSKVAGWCNKVQSPSKRDEALRLSQSFASVAAMVTPGMQPADIVAASVKSNRDALGANIKNWEPFLAALQVELEARGSAGTLSTADQHVQTWREISQALAAYAQTVPTTSSNWRR